ncbi:oocyte zinc finger protein XlCOF15-like isoform X1 [Dermacentor albipictus]|uniref:oocyte zinc finger protein XlCOF15-like isoform X1 n=1 Tax=Dermacentor albipictus TaxID=60249 RepID=UPI0031FCC70F
MSSNPSEYPSLNQSEDVIMDCLDASGSSPVVTDGCQTHSLECPASEETEVVDASNAVFRCFSCGYCFTSQLYLDRHRRANHIEELELKYRCSSCRFSTNKKFNMTEHEKLHMGERPFACDVCHRNFPRIRDLRAHSASHANGKTFDCPACGKRFAWPSSMYRHRQAQHRDGPKPHVCPECGKQFARKDSVRKHLLRHNDKT